MLYCSRNNKRYQGFTLVEILIVTVIIAVLSSIAIPRFRRTYEQFQLSVLTQKFSRLAQTAHELAMLEGRAYKIFLSRQTASFTLFRAPDREDEPYERLSGNLGKDQMLPLGFQIKADEEEIFFYPDGSATETELEFENIQEDRKHLKISLTGKVSEG
ncbi:MAG: prepilin-type N-terminal cleavage/methylation domain-containing protein [Chlamydiae bacterium]|nr:prepilin-type N-terminal cleavage/methylation domain-containing protein [Chlamydiota bacterium]MBI3267190.1 prepilin-type N-terminal cleavage/methylation domain-containing protein [Chlamydiota bacterium]